MTRRLLVTGGAGFIGTNFTHRWTATRPDDRVVVLDAFTYAGNFQSIAALESTGRIHLVEGDIRDFDLVTDLLRREAIDTIVHFAAESHVDRSIHGPAEFVSTNVNGTQSLLDAARATWLNDSVPHHRFHHISTDEVYGSLGPADPAFTETTRYDPRSPYAASKAASDHLVQAYGHTYGLSYSISNCSNNYGPYQFPEKLIPLCIVNMLDGRALPVYGDGSNVRDWLYVEDHCAALEAILDGSPSGSTWNIGGECERTNLDLLNILCDTMDRAFTLDPSLAERFPQNPAVKGATNRELITFVTDRPGHDRRYAIDARKLKQRLGFKPGTDLSSGLQQTVTWYLQNESWWRSILSGEYASWVSKHYARSDGPRSGAPR